MIDAKMKRTMKWHTEGYIDTDVVRKLAIKKSLENMDRDSLRRLLNTSYGMTPAYDDILTMVVLQELQRRYKEENKMEDKKYYSGSVAVTTWRSRRTFNDLDDVMSNHRTDLITFKDGRYFGVLLDPKVNPPAKIPINTNDTRKRYTKEDISELITTAWDKGEYAEDQTDISWVFNSDPEGFTGTVDLATVLLKYPKGIPGHADTQVRARCRVRIVDGTFFEKLDGSSKLADILKDHKGVFETKEAIEMYIKNKWYVGDFGNDASYFRLEIEEES